MLLTDSVQRAFDHPLTLTGLLFACTVIVGLIVLVPEILEKIRSLVRTSLQEAVRGVHWLAMCMATHLFPSWVGALRRVTRAVTGQRWLVLSIAAAAFFTGGILFVLPERAVVSSFERTAHQVTHGDGQVASLLDGEHLTPPQDLPPALFATREVEMLRPRLATASRAWVRLDDAFMQKLLQAYQLMKDRHGYDMALLEGYRSPERQDELAAMGSHVTSASAYQSYHQFGLAADSAFMRDGKLVISEKDAWAMRGYELFGQVAAEVGLVWGGSWKMRDLGHVELRDGRGPRSR